VTKFEHKIAALDLVLLVKRHYVDMRFSTILYKHVSLRIICETRFVLFESVF